MNRVFLAVAAGVVLAAGCVKEQAGMEPAGDETGIVADAPMIIAEQSEPLTRTCIDAAADATGTLPMLWEASDEVGVFFEDGSSNAKYVNASGKVANASFGAAAAVNGTTIKYVYYPYDAANDGKEATALSGNVPSEQAMDGSIHGDYKWGELKAQVEEGYKFKFHNLFSLVRFNINAEGTVLAGETLESVTLTVTRNGEAVPVTGDFTFSAADGDYALGTTSNVLKTTWNQALSGTLSSFASVFPEIESGDQLTFVLETTNYKATLTVTSKAGFAPAMYYTFPLTLANFSGLKVNKIISGTFTAATYNIDGIGLSLINGDGPGSSGTKNISQAITNGTWDFVAFSEDFAYHSELTSNMGGFTFGTYRGDLENYFSALLGTVYDTDGLGFATRNSTCSFTGEKCIEFTSEYGGVTAGANTCIKKGFRYYLVTLEDGIQIDVLITHMNTYDTNNHLNAQHAQLTQIAQYINSIRGNNRPIIFMGDTNCRYTRHDFQTYFWGKLDGDLTYNDPWVEFQRNNTYPAYPSNSLVVEDAYNPDNDSNDIKCGEQDGEVVDKIIYINNPDAPVQIKANNYKRDADYREMADHWPIVSEFSYTGTITVE